MKKKFGFGHKFNVERDFEGGHGPSTVSTLRLENLGPTEKILLQLENTAGSSVISPGSLKQLVDYVELRTGGSRLSMYTIDQIIDVQMEYFHAVGGNPLVSGGNSNGILAIPFVFNQAIKHVAEQKLGRAGQGKLGDLTIKIKWKSTMITTIGRVRCYTLRSDIEDEAPGFIFTTTVVNATQSTSDEHTFSGWSESRGRIVAIMLTEGSGEIESVRLTDGSKIHYDDVPVEALRYFQRDHGRKPPAGWVILDQLLTGTTAGGIQLDPNSDLVLQTRWKTAPGSFQIHAMYLTDVEKFVGKK